MNKEKFHIPMPDERTIQMQIDKLSLAALNKKNRSLLI